MSARKVSKGVLIQIWPASCLSYHLPEFQSVGEFLIFPYHLLLEENMRLVDKHSAEIQSLTYLLKQQGKNPSLCLCLQRL